MLEVTLEKLRRTDNQKNEKDFGKKFRWNGRINGI